jgi:MbtH protein
MNYSDEADAPGYMVLVNGEGQYSLWRDGKEIPQGWRAAGKSGTKGECLQFVDEVWTDMRPLSLQQQDGRLQ